MGCDIPSLAHLILLYRFSVGFEVYNVLEIYFFRFGPDLADDHPINNILMNLCIFLAFEADDSRRDDDVSMIPNVPFLGRLGSYAILCEINVVVSTFRT